jgi:hypothetical protein
MGQGYFIGAFHPIGSNIIVMNKAPLEIALKSTGKNIYNAYCFHLLLHEYLHSLGYIDEETVRELTHEVCQLASGDANPATVMAEKGVGAYFPKVKYFKSQSPVPRDLKIEIIRGFDMPSVGYIS